MGRNETAFTPPQTAAELAVTRALYGLRYLAPPSAHASQPQSRHAPAPVHTSHAPQRRIDRARQEFNFERPHEALDMQPPASRYEASPREMPNTLPPLAYPNRFQVRYASAKGDIRWNRQWVNISITCASQYVSLKEIDEGVWNVYFGALKLGRLHERHMRIEDALGRLR
jgi:putative transposase